MESAIELNDLRYTYREGVFLRQATALKGISLEVPAGSCFGFLGHNGAGKTTTIKSILNLIRPTGTIRIFKKDSRSADARAEIGYLPEQPYFYDHLTVQETMEFFAQLAGVSRADAGGRVTSALERVKMLPRASTRMRALSKGLTQRVGMAQAIVAAPKLLILDEPFSGLDPIGWREFRELISEMHQRGTTIFMCTHVLSDVEFLCDEVAIIAQGELRGCFKLRDELFAAEDRYELVVSGGTVAEQALSSIAGERRREGELLRLALTGREVAEQALQRAVGQHLQIQSFERTRASLEDIFVRLVQFEEARSQRGAG